MPPRPQNGSQNGPKMEPKCALGAPRDPPGPPRGPRVQIWTKFGAHFGPKSDPKIYPRCMLNGKMLAQSPVWKHLLSPPSFFSILNHGFDIFVTKNWEKMLTKCLLIFIALLLHPLLENIDFYVLSSTV